MTHTSFLLFKQPRQIRWQDLDAFNHVNHSVYLIYMQECRIEWLAQHGISMGSEQRGPVIGEITCKYLRPITYPATICVELYYKQTLGRRILFEQVIRDQANPEHIYASAQITVIWVDFSSGKSISPPPEYNHILTIPLS